MKKIISIITVAASALALTSCQDWLDMPSPTKSDSQTVFQSINRAEMAVMGAYSVTNHQELNYQYMMGTDECISTEGSTNSKNAVANYAYTPDNVPGSTYTNMYAAIEYANSAIRGISGMSGSNDAETKKINMLLGESYAIRAIAYYNLVRIWGDVPQPLVPMDEQPSFYSSRVSRDIIWDQCIEDLQEAARLIPWKAEYNIPTERFSKQAAYGILARVALYAAGYSLRWDLDTYSQGSVELAQRDDPARIKELYKIAYEACGEVITKGENSLLADYDEVFRNLMIKAANAESILEYGIYGSNQPDTRNGYGTGMFCITGSPFGKSQPTMAAIPTLWFEYSEFDQRRDVTICNHAIAEINGTATLNNYLNHTVGKYRATWKSERGFSDSKRDVNVPLLRYSDILLMYAEADNEYNNGPSALAQQYLKDVRMRAFRQDASKIGTIPTNYADFRAAIIQERKLELAFETGLRRTDLVRWGIQYETLTAEKAKVIELANRTGAYASVPTHRAYKKQILTLNSPLIALPIENDKEYTSEPNQTVKDALEADGYTLVNLYAAAGQPWYANEFITTNAVIVDLFRGLTRNKTELVPLKQTQINDNAGLIGQQHPMYQAAN